MPFILAKPWAAVIAFFAMAVMVVARVPYDFGITHTKMDSEWDQMDWSLTTHDYIPNLYQARMSLANGYVGASLAAAGPFFNYDVNETNPEGDEPANVWPLFSRRLSFATISGFYNLQPNGSGTNYPWLNQYGWESFIAGIPHPTSILYTFGDQTLDATVSNETISDFESKISFKTGVGSWSYIWSPENVDAEFNVSYQAFFSRRRPNLIAVESQITPTKDINGFVTDVLDGRSAVRSYLNEKGLDQNTTTIEVSVHPNGLANVTGYEVSVVNFNNGFTDINSRAQSSEPIVSGNETTIGQTFNVNLKAGQTARFFKYIGIASNDKFEDARFTARQAAEGGNATGWNALLQEHQEAWGKLMTDDNVDNFTDPATGELPEDREIKTLQITSVANLYYLLQQLQPDGSGLNDNSISVGGLSSESYAGMIFWDADYWMAPGLNLNFPDYSRQISNFRLKQYPQAIENAKFNNFTNNSILYSWTAGRYGNCTGTGPCVDYEYHLNHDIAFNLLQEYNITQNETWFNNGPRQLIDSAGQMTGQLVDWNETSQSWWVHNMTDPDEYANHEDNGAFTVASSANLLLVLNDLRRNEDLEVNELWQNISKNMEFPQSLAGITLEYQTMNNSVNVKQADVVLLTYPLDFDQYNYTESHKLQDLDYYSNKQSPDGPAMTYSMHAIAANAVSPSGCAAYTYALGGILPYLRAPWYQFSEQNDDNVITNGRQNPAFPFLTGHGGANQIVPFGFLGLRTDQPTMYIEPSLPPQIKHINIRDIYYGGAGIKSFINNTHTTLTRFSTDNIDFLTDKYADGPMPIWVGQPGHDTPTTVYNISIGETIYVQNKMHWKKNTQPGNLNQCRQIYSYENYAPGQFPQAAIDGAIATNWQPHNNKSSSMLVNMTDTPYQPVSGIYFNWGSRPPTNATVFLGNMTEVCDGETQISGPLVELPIDVRGSSSPYNEEVAAAAVVMAYVGNQTFVDISGLAWSGNFAKLAIEGCYECDSQEEEGEEPGATVAEFALIGAGGRMGMNGAQDTVPENPGNSTVVDNSPSSANDTATAQTVTSYVPKSTGTTGVEQDTNSGNKT